MDNLGQSRGDETGTEDKSGAEIKPLWDMTKTGWAILSAIFLLLLLNWGVRAKPQWIRISVANLNVALLAVGFAYLFLRLFKIRSRIVKFIFGALWLLLLPNTAYLFTDLGHLLYQWNNTLSPSGRILLLVQYLLLELCGVMMFLFTFLPFEKIVDQVHVFQKRKVSWLILFNFLIAFGVVLGRYEHINSYVVFTQPLKVLASVLNIFMSFDLFGLVVLFGLLCNVIYFLFRGLLLKRTKRLGFAQD